MDAQWWSPQQTQSKPVNQKGADAIDHSKKQPALLQGPAMGLTMAKDWQGSERQHTTSGHCHELNLCRVWVQSYAPIQIRIESLLQYVSWLDQNLCGRGTWWRQTSSRIGQRQTPRGSWHWHWRWNTHSLWSSPSATSTNSENPKCVRGPMRDAQTRDKHVLLRVTSICDLLEASISKYYIIFLYISCICFPKLSTIRKLEHQQIGPCNSSDVFLCLGNSRPWRTPQWQKCPKWLPKQKRTHANLPTALRSPQRLAPQQYLPDFRWHYCTCCKSMQTRKFTSI